jgi:hypothetical protein
MIVTDTDRHDEFIYVVNPSSLSGYTPEDVIEQHKFIKWVQETDIEYVPSGRYWAMAEAAAKGENYGIYSGFKYQFWAKSWEDARAMYDKWPWRMWCEKRHPEPRQMSIVMKVVGSLEPRTDDKKPGLIAYNTETKFIVWIDKEHLDGMYGGDVELAFTRAVEMNIHHGFRDKMNAMGLDIIPVEQDCITLVFPEDFETSREFTVMVTHTVPYDAKPVDELAIPC